MWEKYGRVGGATDEKIIRRMRFVCWITKVTDMHSEYVIFIEFPRQQQFHESAVTCTRTLLCYRLEWLVGKSKGVQF